MSRMAANTKPCFGPDQTSSAHSFRSAIDSPANACPAIAAPACRHRRMPSAGSVNQAASRLAARRSAAGAPGPLVPHQFSSKVA
jgi:hypothetical protein